MALVSGALTAAAVLALLSPFGVAGAGKNLTKRSDIDLQTCIENFDVHKDKIIRTQDSKDMGAKYINEIDLGSREECLRLCCETDNCDVFVFEEKNSGSCYLFQCGPPEDFKCKFTHHANYSSAILAVNRHLPDLESQIKLTKHEQDLTKLSYRKSETEADTNAQKVQEIKTTPLTTAATENKVLPVSPTKSNLEINPTDLKCSRYQFECRSTKECIAIYNACDGIPQCADGSDEAPELGCPESATTKAATSSHLNPAYDDIAQLNRPIPPQQQQQFPNPAVSSKIYQAPSSQQREQDMGPVQNDQRVDPDFIRPDARNTFMPHSGAYDPPRPPAYPAQIPAQSTNNWIPRQPNQMSQQYPYEDRNSHIFNHKENGIQVSEGQELRYNKHKGAMQQLHRALGYSSAGQAQYGDVNGHENSKMMGYFDDMYRQNQQYQDKWPKNNQEDRYGNRNQYMSEISQNTNRDNWAQNPPQDESERHQQNYNHNQQQQQQQEQTTNWDSEKQHSHHEHEKMAHDLKHSKDLMEKATKTKETKQIKIEKVENHEQHPQYAKVTQYKVAEVLDLQDGIAEAPGGAILSLTLGLIITCVMALLIGCRLRVVRKRIRRGGKSYAHDADYLVNGMYL